MAEPEVLEHENCGYCGGQGNVMGESGREDCPDTEFHDRVTARHQALSNADWITRNLPAVSVARAKNEVRSGTPLEEAASLHAVPADGLGVLLEREDAQIASLENRGWRTMEPPPEEEPYGVMSDSRRASAATLARNTRVDAIAKAFHDAYELLAPVHGYKTREASAVPWEDVPEDNRALMRDTVAALIEGGVIR